VSAGSIVVYFNVFEYRLSHYLLCCISIAVYHFYFERLQEALRLLSDQPEFDVILETCAAIQDKVNRQA
jgi:hypothetical protein